MSLEPEENKNLFSSLQLADSPNRSFPGVLHHRIGDIRDLDTCKRIVEESQPQVVLHLAAQSLVRRSYLQPLDTWSINLQGSLNVLESLRDLNQFCAVVMVTTDKVYKNQEWDYGYREVDRLGGRDPYSASKAAAELAIDSWRFSFCGHAPHQTSNLAIATARAGNVIGGGDWAVDRLIPDVMRAIAAGKPVEVRSSSATRPWQHVLEPLGAYLLLAEKLTAAPNQFSEPFNFGPGLEANRSVQQLIESIFSHWPGSWTDSSDSAALHEAGRLHLQIDKAQHQLGWSPVWSFFTTVERTVHWYRNVYEGLSELDCCLDDLSHYLESFNYVR